MTVLAYSELLRRIAGISQEELELPFKILSKNNTTTKRLNALRTLSQNAPISIGKLLQLLHLPRGGGSYITLQKYFLALEKQRLLERIQTDNVTRWQYSTNAEIFKRYIQN